MRFLVFPWNLQLQILCDLEKTWASYIHFLFNQVIQSGLEFLSQLKILSMERLGAFEK